MAKVEIVNSLAEEIKRKFKGESYKIIQLLETLEDNPRKGKPLGSVGGVVVKEIRYKSFRFYFITDGFKLKCLNESQLTDLLIQFIRMSDKKHQQETINEIKHILRTIGVGGFL